MGAVVGLGESDRNCGETVCGVVVKGPGEKDGQVCILLCPPKKLSSGSVGRTSPS